MPDRPNYGAMQIGDISKVGAGRFIIALALSYALIVQLLLSPGLAMAASQMDSALCLTQSTQTPPHTPLSHHNDGLCASLCAMGAMDTPIYRYAAPVRAPAAAFVRFVIADAQTEFSRRWSGFKARGPPEAA